MSIVNINIARDFSPTPGARLREDGDFSGQEFREDFLEGYFQNSQDETIVEVNFDGVEGYATSFLEEAFGGLARKFGKEICKKKLRFISNEEKILVDVVWGYIEKAND